MNTINNISNKLETLNSMTVVSYGVRRTYKTYKI